MKQRTRTYFFLIAALLVLVYVVLRAALLSFTHDESLSFTIVSGFPEQVNTANNHLLNTELMRLCSQWFGNSEFSLRLPNVLAFVLFLWASYRIVMTTIVSPIAFIIAVLLLLFNPYFIEFFSLARGYGISLACMMTSCYFLLLLRNESPFRVFLRNAGLALGMAGLALWANLAMINFLIAAMLLTVLCYAIKARKAFSIRQLGLVVVLLALSCLPLYLGVQRLLFLKEANELYLGVDKLIDTANSVLFSWRYIPQQVKPWTLYLHYFLYAIMLLGTISVFVKRDFRSPVAFIALLLVVLVGGLVLENALFAAKFPSGRTALFFVPLIALLFVCLLEHMESFYPKLRNVTSIALLVLTFGAVGYFASNMNLTSARDWRYEAHTKEVVLRIQQQAEKENRKLRISNNWLFEPTLNFYIRTRNLNIHPANRDAIWPGADFIYDFTENKPPQGFERLANYPDSESYFLRKL